jgi:hypothetical protein
MPVTEIFDASSLNPRSGSPRYTTAKLYPKNQTLFSINLESQEPDLEELRAVNYLTESNFGIKDLESGQVYDLY